MAFSGGAGLRRRAGPVREAALLADFGACDIAVPLTGLSCLTMSDVGSALFQGLLGRSRGIDDHPVDRADIELFLKSGTLRRRVGRVARAATDAAQSGRKVGHQKESGKPEIQLEIGR